MELIVALGLVGFGAILGGFTVWTWVNQVWDEFDRDLEAGHDLASLPQDKSPEYYVGWHRALERVKRGRR